MEFSTDTRTRMLQLVERIAAELVDPPETLPLHSDTDTRTLQLVESIARRLFLLPQLPSTMAVVTFSVGTTGRDYSTITAWEADLDNAGLYNSGDDAVGECYNDSAFNEAVVINGGGTVGLNSITLTVPAAERHDGTEGAGARIVRTGSSGIQSTVTAAIEWLEIDMNGQAGRALDIQGSIANVLAHGGSGSINAFVYIYNNNVTITNTVIYDVEEKGDFVVAYGIGLTNFGSTQTVLNTTVHNVRFNGVTDTNAFGIGMSTSGTTTLKNAVVTDTSIQAGAGSAQDYMGAVGTSATNASSDSTAPSPIAAEPVVSSVEFVSNSAPYDLHLASGAECIDAGTDLGTTPTGVNYDIDNRDRDALGDTWDVGADEYVAVGGFAGQSYILGGGMVA